MSNGSHFTYNGFFILCTFVSGFDGFVYPSVAFGNHSITVKGTSQDNEISEVILGPLLISPFMVTAACSELGTIITVIIDANQEAVFECQLDDSSFVSCNNQPILPHNIFFNTLYRYIRFSVLGSAQWTAYGYRESKQH